MVVLNAEGGRDLDFRPQSVTIRFHACQLEDDPVILFWRMVHPYFGRPVQDGYNGGDVSVIIQASKRRAPMGSCDLKRRAGSCTGIFEGEISPIAKYPV